MYVGRLMANDGHRIGYAVAKGIVKGALGCSSRRCVLGPYPLRHGGSVASHVPEQVYVVARP